MDRARLAGFCSAYKPAAGDLSSVLARITDEPCCWPARRLYCRRAQRRLSMFVMRAKCHLTRERQEQPLYGPAGEAAAVRPREARWFAGRHRRLVALPYPPARC